MKDIEEVIEDFKKDLKSLLKKYNAELQIEEKQTFKPFVRGEQYIQLTIEGKFFENLGDFLDGD